MLLPRVEAERDRLYRNLVRECSISRDARRARCRALNTWYLTGTGTGTPALYNMLAEHVAASTSFLFAPDSVRWAPKLPPRYGDEFLLELDAARDELQALWSDPTRNFDLTFLSGVELAHVWPTAVFKVHMETPTRPTFSLVPDPADIGVYEERIADWSRQEALCHWFHVGLPTFARLIGRHPQAKDLMRLADDHAMPAMTSGSEILPPAVQRVLIAATTPNMIGSAQSPPDTVMVDPQEVAPTIQLAELWVRDDEDETGWRVVTFWPVTETVLFDRPNPLIPGRHPFHGLTLHPSPRYLWGISELADLTMLQELFSRRLQEIDDTMALQLDPPYFADGLSGITEEKLKVLRKKGGNLTNPVQGSKIQNMAPPMPADAYEHIRALREMFANRSGMPLALRGFVDANVRAGDQMMQQAMLQAGPMLNKAMRVERCAEAIATDLFLLHRRTMNYTLRKADGTKFLLSHLPDDLTAGVVAHSASPLYRQRLMDAAIFAKQAGAIDNESYLELLGLPMDELQLKAKARALAKMQTEAAETEIENKKRETDAKMITAEARKLSAVRPKGSA